MKERAGDQPLPIRNDAPDIQSQVIADIEARRLVGIERYGTALQPHNGRDALRDLYEELLDATMYIRQVMVERDRPRVTIRNTATCGCVSDGGLRLVYACSQHKGGQP